MPFSVIPSRFRTYDGFPDRISHCNSEYSFPHQLRTPSQPFLFVFVRLVIQYKGICVFGKLCNFCRYFMSILQVMGGKLRKNKYDVDSDFHPLTQKNWFLIVLPFTCSLPFQGQRSNPGP